MRDISSTEPLIRPKIGLAHPALTEVRRPNRDVPDLTIQPSHISNGCSFRKGHLYASNSAIDLDRRLARYIAQNIDKRLVEGVVQLALMGGR